MKIAGTFAGLFGAGDTHKKNRNTPLDRSVVKDFEIEDFAGVWYQVARIDNERERGLSHVCTTFMVDADGRIDMRTEGFDCGRGAFEITDSRVSIPSEERQASMKTSGLPFTDRDLNVLEVDADYNFALVAGRSADRMWILSRAPYIPAEDLSYLVARALERGYDITNLVFPEHCPVIAGKEVLIPA